MTETHQELSTRLYSVRSKILDAIEPLRDPDTEVDTGHGMGTSDMWIWIDGREYLVSVSRASYVERDTDRWYVWNKDWTERYGPFLTSKEAYEHQNRC